CELQRNSVEQLGLFLRGFQFRSRFLRQRSANPLDGFQVSRGRFNGELFRQKKIARVARLHCHHVAAVAQLFHVFLKNDLHVFSLCSCFLAPRVFAQQGFTSSALRPPALQPVPVFHVTALRGPLPAPRRAAPVCPPRFQRTATARCYAPA